MAEAKPSADKTKASGAAASSSNKHGEKKDENFLAKTAHSIRDKVHELTDDVKEKTHHLTHGGDSDKNKKDKDHKTTTDSKSKIPSKSPVGDKKGDDDSKPKPAAASSSSATTDKPASATSKPPVSDAPKEDTKETKTAAPTPAAKPDATSGSTPAAKPDSASGATPAAKPGAASGSTPAAKPDATSAATPAAKPDAPSGAPSSKPADDKPVAAPSGRSPSHAGTDAPSSQPKTGTDSNKAANQPSGGENTKDHVHISLQGVYTVDDLLDRIDEAVENAKIVVDDDKETTARADENNPTKPAPSLADVEKKPIGDHKDEQEPIRINCSDIRTIEDLLEKVNEQPGSRKLTLENLPDNAATVKVQKRNSSVNSVPTQQPNAQETSDAPTAPKSILKTSHDPSSSDTSTKTASFQDDQIHLRLDGVHNVNELLDRVDDKVQHLPVIIDGQPHGDKRQAPPAPKPSDTTQAKASTPAADKPAPQVSSATDDSKSTDKAPEKDQQAPPGHHAAVDDKSVPVFKLPEHEFDGDKKSSNAQASAPKAQENPPQTKKETDEWI